MRKTSRGGTAWTARKECPAAPNTRTRVLVHPLESRGSQLAVVGGGAWEMDSCAGRLIHPRYPCGGDSKTSIRSIGAPETHHIREVTPDISSRRLGFGNVGPFLLYPVGKRQRGKVLGKAQFFSSARRERYRMAIIPRAFTDLVSYRIISHSIFDVY